MFTHDVITYEYLIILIVHFLFVILFLLFFFFFVIFFLIVLFFFFFFFFQAEDGIRDRDVTGVQTCALPIYYCPAWPTIWRKGLAADDPDVSVVLLDRWELMDRRLNGTYQHVGQPDFDTRSEERRVGKECRSRRVQDD